MLLLRVLSVGSAAAVVPFDALALAMGNLVKPYALGLALSRPWREAVLPLAVTALVLTTLMPVGLPDIPDAIKSPFNWSPWRLVTLLFDLPPVSLFLAFAALLVATARAQVGRGIALGLFLMPLVWPHTAAIVLLPWSWAAADWLRRARQRPPGLRGVGELVLLVAAFWTLSRTVPVWDWIRWLPADLQVQAGQLLGAALPPCMIALVAWRTTDPPWLLGRWEQVEPAAPEG